MHSLQSSLKSHPGGHIGYFAWCYRNGSTRNRPKNLGPIGSAVLTFIGHKQTNRQTDKPNLYINLACLSVCLFVSNKRQNG